MVCAAVLMGLGSCIESGEHYEECVDIEDARCVVRDLCSEDFPDFDLRHCQIYAGENCRVRGILGEFKKSDVEDCKDAILALPCDDPNLVDDDEDETESIPECDFIEGDPEDDE